MAITIAEDFSGNENHGTWVGQAGDLVEGAVSGDPNRAAEFQNVDMYLEVDDAIGDLVGDATYSFGCWVMPYASSVDNSVNGMAVMAINDSVNERAGDPDGYENFIIIRWSMDNLAGGIDRFGLQVQDNTRTERQPENHVRRALNEWYFVTVTATSTAVRLYVDVSNTLTISPKVTPTIRSSMLFSFGQEWNNPGGDSGGPSTWEPEPSDFFYGRLDEAFLLPYVMSTAQMQTLYDIATGVTAGSYRDAVLALNPTGYWRMDDFPARTLNLRMNRRASQTRNRGGVHDPSKQDSIRNPGSGVFV